MENLRKQINNLTKAMMKNEYNADMFIDIYETLHNMPGVPDSVYTLVYNTDVLMYNGMHEEALESLNAFKKEVNEKPSIADLKTIQKCVRNLIEAIDNNEGTNEHVKNLNGAMRTSKFNFEIALLLTNNLETINSNIDKSIEIIQLHMVKRRLIDESATHDSIGVLYNLPFACLMAVASA
jgi:hypothetical protein